MKNRLAKDWLLKIWSWKRNWCQILLDVSKTTLYYLSNRRNTLSEYNSKDDYNWFKDNRSKIIEKHIGESVVIQNRNIVGYYPNDQLALESMAGKKLGTFIIQRCFPEEQNDMFYYTGRYSFKWISLLLPFLLIVYLMSCSFYDFLSLLLIRILTIIENGVIIFIGEMDETKGD